MKPLILASTLVAVTLATHHLTSAADEQTNRYIVYTVECKTDAGCAALRATLAEKHAGHASVFCHYQRFFDLFVSADAAGTAALRTITTSEHYYWHEDTGDAVAPEPPPGRPGSGMRGDPDEIIRGPVEGFSGKGVIVAVLDTGIDYFNKDFRDPETGKTRLLYYWDTFAVPPRKGDFGLSEKPPVIYPNGVGVGALYTSDELNEAIRDNDRSIRIDNQGHGTACATVAAGNGATSGGKQRGVAPRADLVAVRIGKVTMENAWLLNAICGWLDDLGRKRNQPVVISCSFGGHYGGYDGNDVELRQLNARFAPDRVGRALCVSAGNDGYQPVHTELSLAAGAAGKLSWKAPKGGVLRLLFNTDDLAAVRFSGDYAREAEGGLRFYLPSRQIRTSITVKAGEGTLELQSKGKAVHTDAYILGSEGRRMNTEFVEPKAIMTKLVTRPATTPNAITVGSYDWNPNGVEGKPEDVSIRRGVVDAMRVGAISAYSSPGPTRAPDKKDALKPDLVAPGEWFIVNVPTAVRDRRGDFDTFNGTSAATPYAAGVVSLMLEARPTLTAGDIKAWLGRHVKSDEFTNELGAVPNNYWGRGKLNAIAVRAILKDLKDGKQLPK